LSHLGLGNGRSALFTSWDAAHAFMNGRPSGAQFAVSYSWNDGAKGHVLVAQKNEHDVSYRDFQALGNEVPRPDKAAPGIIVTPLTELGGLPNRGLFSKSAVLNERQVSGADRETLTRNLLSVGLRTGNVKRDWATLLGEMRPRPVPAAAPNRNAFLRFVRNPLAFIRGTGPTTVANVATAARADAGRPSRQGSEQVIGQVSTSSSVATHDDVASAVTTTPEPARPESRGPTKTPLASSQQSRPAVGDKSSTVAEPSTKTSTSDTVTAPSSSKPSVAGGPWARREQFKQYRDERLASLVRPPRMMQQPFKSNSSEVCR